MHPTIKKILPHLGAILIFFIVALIYFKPFVFDNMVLGQQDGIQASGMQGEIRKVLEETGEMPLWTNSMFSGMPSYQILFHTGNPLKYVFKGFLLGNVMSPPWPPVFLLMAGFYLLMLVMKVDWRIALIGGLSFGLATNHIILVEAGHMTKLVASAYMAPILVGVLLALRGRYILGGALTGLFVAMQLIANHVQITYYFVIILAIFGLIVFIDAIRKKELAQFSKAAMAIVLGGLIGIACNTSRLWTTYEYSKESIRGESELSKKEDSSGATADQKGGGLSYEYGFNYSYGVAESFNMMIPAYRGGSSMKILSDKKGSEVAKVIRSSSFQKLDSQTQNLLYGRVQTEYWGEQPPTSGGVYFGAIIFLLFFVGLFLVNNTLRWWAIIGVVLTVMLAWGKNFPAFNYWIFDTIPMYNKFRAQTMILGITNLLVAIVAFRGLQSFLEKNTSDEQRKKALMYGGGIMLAFLGLAAFLAMQSTFISTQNEYILSQLPNDIASSFRNAVAADRGDLLWDDLFRTFLFSAAGLGLLWLALKGKIKPSYIVIAVGLLAIIDLWGVDKRYLDYERFQKKNKVESSIQPKAEDKQILADKDPHYRVFDMRGQNPYNNALTSLHHKSVGGYHAAKLMRYQELVERYMGRGIGQDNVQLFNMLNTKYLISPEGKVQQNPAAFGNAWFVEKFRIVEDGDAEMDALATLNPKEEVVVAQKYAAPFEGFDLQFDSTATIQLTNYNPDRMVYNYSAKSPQIAVFSEVYYPEELGWHLYLDGTRLEGLTKANFVLRAAKLPEGQHELVMAFEPQSYKTGELISIASGILILLLTMYGLFLMFKNNRLGDPNLLPDWAESKEEEGQPAKKTVSKRKPRK